MFSINRKRFWLLLKTGLALGIVFGVARLFIKILSQPELDQLTFQPRIELLVLAGLLYLLAQCCWGSFWVRLLRGQGLPVPWYAGMRTYFVSQFGKYIPGKVMVLFMRVVMLRPLGAHPLPVALTAVYETLTSMGSGALLAFLLLPYLGVLPPQLSGQTTALLSLALLPVSLGVLNKYAARLAARRRGPDARPLPAPSIFLLAQGLLHGICGWCLLGLSLGLTVRALAPGSAAMGDTYLADLGSVAIAYVAGFVILVAPGGLGVREWVFQVTLSPRFEPELGSAGAAILAVIIALVIRLTWTIAEVSLALPLYLLSRTPSPPRQRLDQGAVSEVEKADPGPA
jgi:uncharacterized membrane protein YbhN (UPF0104 family)